MKTTLLIIIAAFAAATISTADIQISDSGQVTKDGVALGAIPDAMLNGMAKPSEVQAALVAKFAASAKAAQDAAAEAAKHQAAKQAIVDALIAAAGKTTAAEKVAAFSAVVQDAKADAKAKRIAEINAAIAAKQAELAEAQKQ